MKYTYVLVEQRKRANTTDCVVHFVSDDRTPFEEMILSLCQELEYETFNLYYNNSYTLGSALSMAKYKATEYAETFKIIKTLKMEGIYNE
jgi:hypothetical protein